MTYPSLKKQSLVGIPSCDQYISPSVFLPCLTLIRPGGGGGWNPPPLDILRDNFVEFFLRAQRFCDFFLSSLAQLLTLFS